MHMKAVTWHGKRDVRVDSVPDPIIEESTDAIIEITSTNICGSDLHLYEVLGAFMNPGDILGHEPMGIVREVGRDITNLAVGDRVVIPFQISCGSCYMCDLQLYTQCETTQVRDQGMGAALFGYSELYGSVPGGQAELLRVPQAQFTHIKVPEGPPVCRLRRHPGRRLGHGAGSRSDRRHGRTDRRPPRLPGDRRRSGARTA